MAEKRPILKLPLAILFLAALVLWPVVGVSRPMRADFLTNPQIAAYVICFGTACMAYWEEVASLFQLNKNQLKLRLNVLAWCSYLSLFLTSCLLCRRLKVCMIHIHGASAAVFGWLGLPLVLVGAVMILRSRAPRAAEKPGLIAYPQFAGLLLMLAGVAISHWAWLPLMALPGILVVESWYIRGKERLEPAKVDATSQQARFRILPFIY